MEVIKQGLALCKAELVALKEFTMKGHDKWQYAWFRGKGRELGITAFDGFRVLDVWWMAPDVHTLPETEVGLTHGFLAHAVDDIKSAEANRVVFDLKKLTDAAAGKCKAEYYVFNMETRSGIPEQVGYWAEDGVTSTQMDIEVMSLRKHMEPPAPTDDVLRQFAFRAANLSGTSYVENACHGAYCTMHAPKQGNPALVVFEDAASGARWSVVVTQFNTDPEIRSKEEAEEAARLGGRQVPLIDRVMETPAGKPMEAQRKRVQKPRKVMQATQAEPEG